MEVGIEASESARRTRSRALNQQDRARHRQTVPTAWITPTVIFEAPVITQQQDRPNWPSHKGEGGR